MASSGRGGARSDAAKQDLPASSADLLVDSGPQDPDLWDESMPFDESLVFDEDMLFEDEPPSPSLDPVVVVPVSHHHTLIALPRGTESSPRKRPLERPSLNLLRWQVKSRSTMRAAVTVTSSRRSATTVFLNSSSIQRGRNTNPRASGAFRSPSELSASLLALPRRPPRVEPAPAASPTPSNQTGEQEVAREQYLELD